MGKEDRTNGTKSTLEAEKSVFEQKCYEAYSFDGCSLTERR
ncbi:hypothetical protein [Clostridium sp. AF50-3]|nr:hypothetical protein [Clostridium sp. AF50-3]